MTNLRDVSPSGSCSMYKRERQGSGLQEPNARNDSAGNSNLGVQEEYDLALGRSAEPT